MRRLRWSSLLTVLTLTTVSVTGCGMLQGSSIGSSGPSGTNPANTVAAAANRTLTTGTAVPQLPGQTPTANLPGHHSDSNATVTSTDGNSNTSGTSSPGNIVSTEPGIPQQSPKLVPYNGPFQHVFFHPLIAFPSVTFSKADPQITGFNDWFVTVSEFDKILHALYQQNYILVDINSLYTETTKDGITYIHKKQLMLPKGKKPLVLSVDDMNYYDYMQKWGTVQRLVLDANGNVAALSKFPDGHTAVTYNNAIVPILDQFVQEHPDFSFEGAKGTINLTGYQGVLGYRTNDTSAPDYQQTKADAMQVIARLKQTGWTFASHGWGHLPDATISYSTFVADTNRWIKEVEPLVGPTQVYVYPFGSRVTTGGRKYQYLIQKGFHVLCSVGPTTYVQWTPQTLMMDRMHIDGISLHSERKSLNILLGNAQILDPIRPKKY